MTIRYAETKYGFDYGAASITRIFSDEKKGWITLGLVTPKADLQIYVTRTGKVRIHGGGKSGRAEWIVQDEQKPAKRTKRARGEHKFTIVAKGTMSRSFARNAIICAMARRQPDGTRLHLSK